jgi:putative endonuclease
MRPAGTRPAPTCAEARRGEPRRREPGRRTDPRRGIGRHGEQLAAEHMRRLGFKTLQQNVRTRHGEIDLICFDGRTLVFAEVKTLRMSGGARAPRLDQQPLTWLRRSQRERLRRLAVAWLSAENRARPTARTIRFDAIGVTIDAAGALQRIEHVEDAW